MTECAAFACRLCDGDGLRLYYTLGGDGRFKYYKCPTCGLVNYDLATGLDQTQYEATHFDPRDDTLKFNLDKDQSYRALSRFVQPPGRLLDIGCGNGRLLYLAKTAGWRVKGLELSASMAAFVRQELDVAVDIGDFLELEPDRADTGVYDVVVLRHVIEHLPDSPGAMERISTYLKPDGCLLLEMPNIEAMTKKWSRLVVGAGLYERNFDDDFMAGHCNEFSRRAMGFLAARTGYRLLRWETYSRKPLPNWFYNRVPIGNKARALLRRSAN